MIVETKARMHFMTSPEAVYDLMVDAARFPLTFAGYGPIPAIREVLLDGALRVGGTRRIANSDGSVLTEKVTRLDQPAGQSYTLLGFRPPFSWLVTRGEANWRIQKANSGTDVAWRYAFTLTTPLVYPLGVLVIRFFMRQAMRRCLAAMADLLAAGGSKA